MRKLQENPDDSEAQTQMDNAQELLSKWSGGGRKLKIFNVKMYLVNFQYSVYSLFLKSLFLMLTMYFYSGR